MSARGNARPLRWWKFAAFLLPAAICVGRGRAGGAALLRLLWMGELPLFDVDAALHGAVLGLAGLAGCGALVRDAGWDRIAPRSLLAGVVALALLPLRPPAAAAGLDAALVRCGGQLALALQRDPAAPPPPACTEPVAIDRWLRRRPVVIHETAGADGPLRQVPAGLRYGALLVARGPGGRLGWITAVSRGGALLRDGQGIWVAGFAPAGGAR
ncbi:hypothetical protein [Vulgatibacter sp.]|uniref:hypothetical protein n=1 Tax=Vulgatibacter sp. TaxID=1971226 RepID=UPI003564C943